MATEYIISQIKNNVQFLQSINQISSEDARHILSKLPGSDNVPPRPGTSSYRALWAYNENGQQEAKYLAFKAGEIIQVTDQTNSDWWTGRLNGREGIFPSSYVERVPDTSQPHFQQRPPPPMPRQHGNFPNFHPGHPGPPGPHPYPQQPQYFGPPHGNMYPPNPGPGPYLGLPQAPVANAEQTQNQGGGLGRTLADSAVGGVGFGAGSAVGGGIIKSLFD